MITLSVRRVAATGGLLAALTAGSVLAAGAASASTDTTTGTTATVAPLTLAPGCVGFTQYQHDDHANVYLDNNCSTSVRVKVIMKYGTDSHCISLTRGQQNYKFVSQADTLLGFAKVDHIDAC